MKHSIIIRQNRPWLRLALTTLIAMLLALAGFALYRYTRQSTVVDFEKATSERDQLQGERRSLGQQLRAANSEVSRLRDELAYAEQSKTIDGDACKSVKDSFSKLAGESAALREQLAFYRGIVSPKEARAGVRVQELKMQRIAIGWKYDLVLIQSVREEGRIAGTIELSIEGVQGATKTTLAMPDLLMSGDKNLVFSFKYFEEFKGEFRLPTGFKPLSAVVTLKPVDDRPAIVDQYDWAKIETQQERSKD